MSDDGWLPIESCPKFKHQQYMLCNTEREWIRFGRWFSQQREWYYSATNERSQFAQTAGDAPTHWRPIPSLPSPEAHD